MGVHQQSSVVAVVNHYSDSLNCEGVCEKLEEAAVESWRTRDVVVDDITVLLVYLRPVHH
jgi:hypothetical protein